MDLDEGLGSHVEEFARELDDKKAPSGSAAPGHNGEQGEEDEEGFEDEYDDIEDEDCEA